MAASPCRRLQPRSEQCRASRRRRSCVNIIFCLLLIGHGASHASSSSSHTLAFASTLSTTRQLCVVTNDDFATESSAIASSLSIPLVWESSLHGNTFSHVLQVLPYAVSPETNTYSLGIQSLGDGGGVQYAGLSSDRGQKHKRKTKTSKVQSKCKPFVVDFCPPTTGNAGPARSGTDLLIKAAFPKRSSSSTIGGPVVYDLTAGFGQDSLVMALSGAQKVLMVERDPIVAALLSDALRRLRALSEASDPCDPDRSKIAAALAGKLELRIGEGADILRSILNGDLPRPDVVYLDPMFPPRTKSAAVKKNMQILHGLLDTQNTDSTDDLSVPLLRQEAQTLIRLSVEVAGSRVAVKRPLRAEPLGGSDKTMAPQPAFAINGSTNRWDVYVK